MAAFSTFEGLSYPHLLAATIGAIVVGVLSTAVYRLYFHHLAQYPGPLWARLSVWPSYLRTVKGDRHIWLYELHQKYGPVVRYRPDAVVFNTPAAYKTIMGPKGNVKKTESYYRTWPHNINLTNTWNVTNLEAHARKRRVLNQAFSDRALRGAEPHVHSNLDRWLDLVKGKVAAGTEWTPSLNMADEANYLIFDILGDLCFGKSFDMKEPESDIKNIPELMGAFLKLMHPVAVSPWADWWMWAKPRGLDWLLSFAVPEDLKKWQAFVAGNLNKRTKAEQELKQSGQGEGAARKDFFHYLFEAKDPATGKDGYSMNELWAECELLTIAGSDTTSIVTAAMTFYLGRDQRIQDKLAKEIRTTFSAFEEITAGPKLQSCKYLKAFITEVLRMTPPVPAELMREVLPGGTTVEGRFFPADTKVSSCLYSLSYSDELYEKPFVCRPERWLTDKEDPEGDPAEKVALADSGFCSFSTGNRGCVGMNMAWMEMKIVLAKLIYTFEMRQDSGDNLGGGTETSGPRTKDVYQLYDAFVAMRNGPMVQFRLRE